MSSPKRIHATGGLLGVLFLTLVCSSDAVPNRPKAPSESKHATEPKRAAGSKPAAEPKAAAASLQQGPVDNVRQLARVWVHGTSIYPAVINLRPGTVLIRVENETDSAVNLVVEKVQASQPNQPTTSVGTNDAVIRATQVVQVGEGEYVFYEVSRPTLKGRLVVSAH